MLQHLKWYTILNGQVVDNARNTEYSVLGDTLARRTFDESGDYTVYGLGIKLAESLSDNLGNGGVYQFNQKTEQGETPSDDLAVVKVSAGKAYVVVMTSATQEQSI